MDLSKNKLVSAIITTYMRSPLIVERAINSILNQTYNNLEVIVVDDSPSSYKDRDKVRELVEKYKNRGVKYISHEKNMGACVARNTGLAAANGEFIAYLDDDDVWLSDKIEKQMSLFEDEIGLVYCGSKTINDDTGEIRLRASKFYGGMIYDSLIKRNYIGSTSFPIIKKSALLKVGAFDPKMKSAQDYDVWLRIAKEYKISFTNEPLVLYHEHNGERISKNNYNRIQGLERLNEKNIDYLKKHKGIWSLRIIRITPYYATVDKKKALLEYCRAVLMDPFKFFRNLHYLFLIIKA